MKTRTNQPVFLDNGELVNDGGLGGTKLYKHTINAINQADSNKPVKLEIVTTRSTEYAGVGSINDLIYTGKLIINNDTMNPIVVIAIAFGAICGFNLGTNQYTNYFGSFIIQDYNITVL